jgi:hypothetical protein
MKVIGAGLPRTATLSQKAALERLGFGPCYHMVNVLADLSLVGQWNDALAGDADWERTLDGFESTVDWPGGFFYRELSELYPEAKVLLSIRDPDSWERSMRSTVWGIAYGDVLIHHLSCATELVKPEWHAYMDLMRALLWEGRGTLADRHSEPGGLVAAMERHTDAVRAAIPPERLLVWDVREGWEPLCAFLEVDVPSEPIPHLNDGKIFEDRIVEMALASVGTWWERTQRAESSG